MALSFKEDQSPNENSNPLLRFWTDTRLSNSIALSALGTKTALSQSAADYSRMQSRVFNAINLGCGPRDGEKNLRGGELIAARNVPSAGALYPYDVHIIVAHEDQPAVYLFDVENNQMIEENSLSLAQLGRAIRLPDAVSADLAAIVIISARPWRSMKKYGDRGYCYSCLDVAHAAVGIAGAAEAQGLDVSVFLRICRKKVATIMGFDGSCLEPQVALAVTWKGLTGSPEVGTRKSNLEIVSKRGLAAPNNQRKPDSYERRAWNRLRGTMPFHEDFPPPAHTARFSSLLRSSAEEGTGPFAQVRPVQDAIWRDLFERANQRQSARGFLPGGLNLDQVENMISGLNATLKMDCVDRDLPIGVSLSVLTNEIRGMTDGTHRVSETNQLEYIEAAGMPPSFQDACMNQQVVSNASGLLVLHAPVLDVVLDLDRASFAELHFHAGHIAHKLYLSAARFGLGITSIGGFDEKILTRALCSGSGEGVLYALAFGQSDQLAQKLDLEKIAYAHGEVAAPDIIQNNPV